MIGPLPSGTFTVKPAINGGERWENLEAGRYYQVVREFFDSDHDIHQAGESRKFLGYSFNHYDEGLSLFVSFDNVSEWNIPLQHTPGEQGVLLDNLSEFICERKN